MFNRRYFMASAGAGLIGSCLCTRTMAWTTMASQLDVKTIDWERIEARARELFETNRMDTSIGFFHVPSAVTYRSFFAWDSGWNVIANMRLDPESAVRELETIFSFQRESGHVPHEVRVPELKERKLERKLTIAAVKNQYDEQGRSRFIDPPSFLITAALLYKETGDERILDLLPKMERCAEYLTRDRDLFGDGLVSIIHPWESGTDTAPVFDEPMGIKPNKLMAVQYGAKYPELLNFNHGHGWSLGELKRQNRFVMEEVGINSVTARGLQAIAELCEEASKKGRAGYDKKAGKYRDRAADMVKAMEEIFWDNERGFFYPRYDVKERKLSRRACLTGMLPLLTGLVGEDKAARVIGGYLTSPKHFDTPFGVPFNSEDELAGENFLFEDAMLWRGRCVWANMNWMMAEALDSYGRTDLSLDITLNTAKMVEEQGFFEFYGPDTGEGLGAAGFTWPALVIDMGARRGR